jgi:hypothetical protein
MALPVSTKRMCPPDAQCVFGTGFVLAGVLSRRWEPGSSLGFGYELWLQNANDVYEVGVSQVFAAVLQHRFRADKRVRPYLRLRGGLLLFGESFRVAALGGLAELGAGVELDATDHTAFTFNVGAAVLRTGSFTTPSDGVLRAADGAIDAAVLLRLGYLFLL